jgi:hypothetical protein
MIPEWPLVVDLDGDGRAEIVVADSGPLDAKNGYRGVRMLDGPTGRPRWTRPMRPDSIGDDGVIHIIDGPDLDRDGTRDVVTASIFIGRRPTTAFQRGPGEPERIYVDALSGKDGRPLWWWHVATPTDRSPFVWSPRWWGRGPDGWPLLAVPITNGYFDPRYQAAERRPSDTLPSTVHVLEASTGREVHTVVGLEPARVDDLNGDGLLDLWGAFENKLRGFAGVAPEAWRSLESLASAADSFRQDPGDDGRCAADLDGDGIGDALTIGVQAPVDSPDRAGRAPGSRIALARSGRDGHLLWKTDLGVRRRWFERDMGENYRLSTFPMPAGDFDGDGTADIAVLEYTQKPPAPGDTSPATLPLLVLAGRTGRPLWIAGPLPLGFEAHGFAPVQWVEPRIVEPTSPPDLIVCHGTPASMPTAVANVPGTMLRGRLARISGRTGRFVWDVPLEDQPARQPVGAGPNPAFHDLDGDGSLDVVYVSPAVTGAGYTEFELKAVSLREGRRLWSRPLLTGAVASWIHDPVIFDPDATERPVVILLSLVAQAQGPELVVQALDGGDSTVRWTRSVGQELQPNQRALLAVARLGDGRGGRIHVSFRDSAGKDHIVVLGLDGRECGQRDLPGSMGISLVRAVDLDGDGRDEVIGWSGDGLRAWDGDGNASWAWPAQVPMAPAVLPASRDRPVELLLPPGLALDGRTGRPRWRDCSYLPVQYRPALLDRGDSGRRPMLLSYPLGATVCRRALPTLPDGSYAPSVGSMTPPGLAEGDPRWIRTLPWTEPIVYTIGLKGFLALAGLALGNVAVPLGLLWLAARRRPWTLRLLMALPVAAAVPLSLFQTVEPLVPVQIGPWPASTRLVFVAGTLAGIPLVAAAVLVIGCLVRRRWKPLAWFAGSSLAASVILAGVWFWSDRRSMPAIERYDRSNVYLAGLLGCYAVAVLVVLGGSVRGIVRAIWRRRTRPAGPVDAGRGEPTM